MLLHAICLLGSLNYANDYINTRSAAYSLVSCKTWDSTMLGCELNISFVRHRQRFFLGGCNKMLIELLPVT